MLFSNFHISQFYSYKESFFKLYFHVNILHRLLKKNKYSFKVVWANFMVNDAIILAKIINCTARKYAFVEDDEWIVEHDVRFYIGWAKKRLSIVISEEIMHVTIASIVNVGDTKTFTLFIVVKTSRSCLPPFSPFYAQTYKIIIIQTRLKRFQK